MNSHIIFISPDTHKVPLCTSTKFDPWYVIFATKTDTQRQDGDEKKLYEIAEKMSIKVTKIFNTQFNLSVQTVGKVTWRGVMTVKKWKQNKE